jgi:hypothetical protein
MGKRSGGTGGGRRGRARVVGTLADRADRYDLYQRAVQDPEAEVEFLEQQFRRLSGRAARVLREDFCGTFAVAAAWAAKRGREAYAVDLDPEPLEWGRRHNLARLPPSAQARVHVLRQDVRTVGAVRADIVAAENFSFWVFRTREALREYFQVARQNLADDGLFVLDLMGGSECWEEGRVDERACGGFTYEWETARFDPVTNDLVMKIHFAFRDGSRLDEAFTYAWRFWTIPEVRETLAEAGFRRSTVYWEGTDPKTKQGDGVWRPAKEGTADPSWVAYVVAQP